MGKWWRAVGGGSPKDGLGQETERARGSDTMSVASDLFLFPRSCWCPTGWRQGQETAGPGSACQNMGPVCEAWRVCGGGVESTCDG